ncbi:Uu.00g032720.m01.CDS01 [Anthostomella pinea]|uniref:Uu.00g032720.m01.CDS01 n=1 Tax=Anthostomella pinea TaxID=933095 RepID=A0AAI8V8R1_9PEZI|nr:Uu.00g032720.m01.CDS01 [Anthostomella pinea]
MSNQDAHQGGDLFDMAKDGTKVPGDAGKMNTVPSVPDPHQKNASAAGGLGAKSLAGAADNPLEGGETDNNAISATGHSMPASAFSKPSGSGGK